VLVASANNEDDAVLWRNLTRCSIKTTEVESKHICLYSNIKARRNFGLSQFSVQLQQLLDEGHTVRVEEGEKSSAGEQIKGQMDIKLEEAAIANAEKSASSKPKSFLAAHMPLKHSD